MNDISSPVIDSSMLTPVVSGKAEKPLKVLLCYPNTLLTNRIPLALSVLAGCLKHAGHDVVLFDTTFMKIEQGGDVDDEFRENLLQVREANLKEYGVDWEEVENVEVAFRNKVLDEKPDLIAVSIVENTFHIALRLLRAVEDLEVPNILGGVRVTTEPETVISEDCVDMICLGEGEQALLELCAAMGEGNEVTGISNLWVKKDGTVHRNPMRNLTDLATLPRQDWSLFDDSHLYRPIGGVVYRQGNFEMSRGCPFKCQYCVEPGYAEIYKGLQPKSNVRQKPVRDMIDEIIYFRDEYKIDLAFFHDETFLAMPMSRFEEFCELYTKEVGIPYSIQTTANTISETTAKMLEESGCINIAIGLESGNEPFRRNVLKKNITNDHVINAFKILKRHPKIRVSANNIIGFPFETRDMIMDTIKLNRDAKTEASSVNLFYPYRGAPLRDLCIKEGFITGEEEAIGFRTGTVLKMPQITPAQLLALQQTFQFYIRLPNFSLPVVRWLEKALEQKKPLADPLFKFMVLFYKAWTLNRYG